MKLGIITATIVLALAGCGSTKPPPSALDGGQVTPINAQKLSSNFTRRGVKVEFDCAWGTGMFGLTDAVCVKTDLKSIEVTDYAASFGNSESQRENAYRKAEMGAKAKLRRFISEEVNTTQVKTTFAKNVEKANDRIKQRISANEEINMTDDEATRETNWAVRENTNEAVENLTQTIRVNAAGILRGVRVSEAKIVDRQTVQVTIRWDRDTDRASDFLRSRFDGRR
jgi:hypothetical protein